MRSVLFVCSANICRSPLAMALLLARVGPAAGQWRIESAGVWGPPGYPAAVNAVIILKRRGIDLSEHRSRPVDRTLVAGFNLILTMERGQKEALRAAFPEIADRVYLLSEMIDETADIADPIGRSMSYFEHTVLELEDILEKGYERIQALSAEQANAGSVS